MQKIVYNKIGDSYIVLNVCKNYLNFIILYNLFFF